MDDKILTGVCALLLKVQPSITVVWGHQNKIAMPKGMFTVVWVLGSDHLSSHQSIYKDTDNLKIVRQSRSMDLQIDFYGDGAGARADEISSILSDAWACDFFKQHEFQQMYIGQTQNLTGVNGENQYEKRFMVPLKIGYTVETRLPQDFFCSFELDMRPVL